MEYLAVLLPSAGVGAVFYYAMRALVNADRSEREALAAAREKVDSKSGTEQPANISNREGRPES